MRESMKKIMNDMAEKFSEKENDEIIRIFGIHLKMNHTEFETCKDDFRDGFRACYNLLISRMVFDENRITEYASDIRQNHCSGDEVLTGIECAKLQFNQDLKNIKGE